VWVGRGIYKVVGGVDLRDCQNHQLARLLEAVRFERFVTAFFLLLALPDERRTSKSATWSVQDQPTLIGLEGEEFCANPQESRSVPRSDGRAFLQCDQCDLGRAFL
jgi:hypothetical protein